mgnify:CR=1 FL=1
MPRSQAYYLRNMANGLVLDAVHSDGTRNCKDPQLIKKGDHIAYATAVLLNAGYILKHIGGTDDGNSYLFVKFAKIPFNSTNKELKNLEELLDNV